MSSTPQNLWHTLQRAGLTTGDVPPPDETAAPWYVRVLLGIAGWLAALFLLSFLGLAFGDIFKNAPAALMAGCLLIGIAYWLFTHSGRNDFFEQLGLAVSFSGQTLVMFGLFDYLEWHGTLAWVLVALLQGTLAALMPNFLNRLFSAYAAAMAFSLAFAVQGVGFLGTGIIAGAVALFWLNEIAWARKASILSPVGYGLTLALIQASDSLYWWTFLRNLLVKEGATLSNIPLWLGDVVTALVLLWAVYRFLLQAGLSPICRTGVAALAAAALLGLLSCEAPGIGAGVLILLLGFAGGNRILQGLGITSLLFYLSAYYYDLNNTLLDKSILLAASGCVLLAARYGLAQFAAHAEEGANYV